jgi:enoyl-CoA hydratase/carnithine racemase
MTAADQSLVRTERDGDVAFVVFNRPDRRNALTPAMLDLAAAAVSQALSGPARALVLAGDGPCFCGGFDLKLCLDTPGTLATLLKQLSSLVLTLRNADKPVVIAAHTAAIAGGCALLSAADVVVTDHAAKIGYPVVPLGISPAVSAPTLREAIGDGRCRARQLDPGLISGQEAVALGLAHDGVATPDLVRPRTLELARTLAQKPPPAIAATKRLLREIAPIDAARGLDASLSIVDQPEERQRLAALFKK